MPIVLLAWLANMQERQRMREEGTFLRSEEVTENDHAFRDGSGTFDAWRVDLESGQVLRVKIRTSDSAPRFYVIGPMAAESPEVVVRSKPAGTAVATAEFSPSQPGEYSVMVPSQGGVRSTMS